MHDYEVLQAKSLSELRQIAKLIGLHGITAMRKAELLEHIASAAASDSGKDTAKAEIPAPKNRVVPKSSTAGDAINTVKADWVDPGAQGPEAQSEKEKGRQQEAGKVMQSEPAPAPAKERQRPADVVEVKGFLEVLPEGFGFIRFDNYESSAKDIYVSNTQIRRFNLKTGDEILGDARGSGGEEKFAPLLFVHKVNGDSLDMAINRKPFDSLTPIYPTNRIHLETLPNAYSMRLIDLMAPLGKGQRGLIVAPPKAGKTTLLKKIAQSICHNHPDIKLIVLLIDERPEEVTDMKRSIDGEVIYSTFDEAPDHHTKIAELVLERAARLVEHKKDVVILLDSITRLARAYNLVIPPTGRTLSGGLDPGALHKPKRFFGAARNIEEGGSLTILATALVETGSRMDDMIFEEFKGTGNMEVRLDRQLQEKRVFPAIDINKSGTRREEDLLSENELNAVWAVRKAMANRNTADVTEELILKLTRTRTNAEFVQNILDSMGR